MRTWQKGELKRINLLEGSVSSGKTWISLVLWAFWVRVSPKEKLYLMCAKSLTTLKRNCLILLQELVGEGNFTFSIPSKEGYLFERRILFEGANDARAESKIRGMTLQGAYCDELTQFPEDFFAMLLSRLRVPGAKLIATTNPDNPNHWLMKRYIERADELDFLDVKFTIDDNTTLPDDYVENIKREYVGVFYQRFILGLWVAAEGLVYKYGMPGNDGECESFAEHTEEFLIDDPVQWCREHSKQIKRIMLGVDFGGTKSHTAFKAVGITNDCTVIVLDEDHIDSQTLDPDKLSRRFCLFAERIKGTYRECSGFQTRADSAESVLIRGLRNAVSQRNLDISVLNAKKMAINDRIRLTILLMSQKRLFIARKCEHMIDAFQTAVYDPKSYDDVRLDDGTSDIDSLDAFEYCLEPWYQQLIRGAEI